MRPEALTKSYVLEIISVTGRHFGVFQLVEFHAKKPNIYSCYISDGYFRLKVIFLDQAGVSIANQQVALFSIVEAEVYNYSFEDGVYLVKSINQQWMYHQKIGEPKEWRHKKVNNNPTGSRVIQWPHEQAREAVPFTFADKSSNKKSRSSGRKLQLEEPSISVNIVPEALPQAEETSPRFGETQAIVPRSSSKRKSNDQSINEQPQPRSSLKNSPDSFRLQFQQASRLSSGSKQLLLEEEAAPKSPVNVFTEEDFNMLSEILTAQSRDRKSGIKKSRMSTNSQSLNDLLELLEGQSESVPFEPSPSNPPSKADINSESVIPQKDQKEEEQNLQELLQLMALPHEQEEKATELIQSPTSKSNVTARISSNSKKKEQMAFELGVLSKEQELNDLVALIADSERIRASMKKESKIKMKQVPLTSLYPDAEGWSLHVQVVAKGQLVARDFGSKTVSSFNCMLRDSQNSIVEAVFTDKHIHSSITLYSFYFVENGNVCASKNHVVGSLRFTLEFNSKLILQDAPEFEVNQTVLAQCYTPIAEIFSLPVDCLVNIVGVLRDVSTVSYQKDGKAKSRTTYIVVDPLRNSQIEVADFGRFNGKQVDKLQVITVYNAKISKYREIKGLVVTYNTLIKEGNECQAAIQQLRQHCTDEILRDLVPTYSFPAREIHQLKQLEKRLLRQENTIDLSSQLTGTLLSFFKERMYYLSCPQCRKKLQVRGDGKYICVKCSGTKDPVVRYLISATFGDRSGLIQLTFEERLAQALLQLTADQVWGRQLEHNTQALAETNKKFTELEGRLVSIQVTGWLTQYEGEKRVNYTCRSLKVVQVNQRSQQLLSRIGKFIEFI